MNYDTTLKSAFVEQIENTMATTRSDDPWAQSSIFAKAKTLSIDERGRNGQEFIQNVFKGQQKGRNIHFDGVSGNYRSQGDNERTGEWDIKINNWRVEVKTACMDRAGNYQHEGVKRVGTYDFVFFLDIAPNDIYFSVAYYNDIPWDKLHLRGRSNRPTGSGYKWDFKYIYSRNPSPKRPQFWKKVEVAQDMIDVFEECCKKHNLIP